MAVVAGLDHVPAAIIATPGILPYTLIPATADKPAYTAFLLWRDRHTTSLSSSTYWSHCLCPPIKTDTSGLDTVCRSFSAKTKGIWGLDANVLKYVPAGKGRSKKEQKEDLIESHSRIRTKIIAGRGTTLISTTHHLIYILPLRYIDIETLNTWCKEDGECVWIPSQDLFTAFRSDASNASLVVNTHAMDDPTCISSYPLHLPFVASIRTTETMREILDILSQFESTLNTSTTISTTSSTDTTTSTSTSTTTKPISTCYYTCRKCRTRLFADTDIVKHESGNTYAPEFAKKRREMVSIISCSSFFIEPVKTLGEFSEASGTINCPNSKCGMRIGDYDWAGSQCSCGEWITPALQVTISKVDRKVINMSANIVRIKTPEKKSVEGNEIVGLDKMSLDEKNETQVTKMNETTTATTTPATTTAPSATNIPTDPIHTPSASPAIATAT